MASADVSSVMALNVNVPDDAAGADVALIPSVPSRVLPLNAVSTSAGGVPASILTYPHRLSFAQADRLGAPRCRFTLTIVLIIR